MSRQSWHRLSSTTHSGRKATRAAVVEAIDRDTPETKAALSDRVDISEQYLSEILSDLKREGVVRKGYVIDQAALYDQADSVSRLTRARQDEAASTDETARQATNTGRATAVLDLLERLESVTRRQYAAAETVFNGETPDQSADSLESLTNERWSAVLAELKSYTLTTDWPGNRVAADLSTIATDLEIVGDRACFIADAVEHANTDASGVVAERMADIFTAGHTINEHFRAILFETDLTAHDRLRDIEETVHRDLDELFELVTAYDPDVYGYLVTITRALERAIFYWVDAAELAVQLHSGIRPEHVEL
ncbi:MAG: PhoU family transcriptional regulator [Halorhabdus sp.]